jgi:hypothetical protein
MDTFEYPDPFEDPVPTRKSNGIIWDAMTLVVLTATILAGGTFLSIFNNPHTLLNPFPPPIVATATPTPSVTPSPLYILPPTWTPSPTVAATETSTPGPTTTPLISPTPAETAAPAPESEPVSSRGPSFVLQQGSPKALPNIYNPERGCDWMGVGGQAVDLNGAPYIGLIVQLGGSLGGRPYETKLSITGTAPQYDRAGFEFLIADRPIASNRTLWLQLLDQAGLPLSEKIYFDTFNDCEKNLIILYFTQVR